jgi:hypothetical protein
MSILASLRHKSLLFALMTGFGLAESVAQAADSGAANPCGRFDFQSGISCQIKVSGGCSADCSPLNFEAACTGGCSGTATTMCVDDCGIQCVAMCDPAALDCFAGCHGECDEPTVTECKQKHPNDDCAATAKAQCDVHCKDSCAIPPSDCSEHCNKCCTGSCTTQVNFDCDFSCFVDVQGGCDVQCQKPEGAIFCNGQYVHASDVEACIAYLAQQGISVDASARGSLTCDLAGCHEAGSTSTKGCSASAARTGAGGMGAIAVVLAALLASRRRR